MKFIRGYLPRGELLIEIRHCHLNPSDFILQ